MEDLDLATYVMLASMAPDLQKQHEAMNAHDVNLNLRELFAKKNCIERFHVSKKLFHSKMSKSSLVRPHVLKMTGFITRLEQLGWTMDHDLSIDLVLTLLPESYSQSVLNFNMNKIETTLLGLLNMPVQVEKTIVKEKPLIHLVSSKKKSFKRKKKTKKDEGTTSKVLKPNGGVKKDKV